MHTPDAAESIMLLAGAFVAAAVAAVSGFGGAAVLLPILAAVFDVRHTVPILTVAQLIGNASRVGFNRADLNWRVVGWFSVGAVPLAALGGVLFATAPLGALRRLLGVFLIAMVIWRRAVRRPPAPFSVRRFALIGGGFSVLSALVGSVGPVMAPFFLAYGLTRAAYIGTEALCTVVMHVTKLIVYRGMAVLTWPVIAVGAALGPAMIAGSYVGKRIADRLPERVFVAVVEIAMLAAGALFLASG